MKMKRKILTTSFLLMITLFVSFDYFDNSHNDERSLYQVTEHPQNKFPQPSIVSNTWGDNGIAVSSIATSDQIDLDICSDGSGGVILVWEDNRTGVYHIYAQRVNSSGEIHWVSDIELCTNSGSQYNPSICEDGLGGAIITWDDERGIDIDIYAQRIDEDGIRLWSNNGVAISTESDDQGANKQICSDGSGGAIIVWEDEREISHSDIYAQKVDTDGITLWNTDGEYICSSIGDQKYPQICSDGLGGAIIVWEDHRAAKERIYTQRIGNSGSKQWALQGRLLSSIDYIQINPQICSDGSGGGIITWDKLVSGIDYDIYAQKVDLSGVPQWNENGTAICTENDAQFGSKVVSDLTGGAIIAWLDRRSGGNYDIYGQIVNSSGGLKGEIAICTAVDTQFYLDFVSDGVGGGIPVWQNEIYTDDIFVRTITRNGYLRGDANGEVVCDYTGREYGVRITTDGEGGAIVAWSDDRNGNKDIYAQRVSNDIIDPIVEIINPSEDQLFGSDAPSFTLQITEEDIDSRWYTIDSSTFIITGSSGTINETVWDSLSSETIDISFYVNDTNGNRGSAVIQVRKDIIPPTISINTPTVNQEFETIPSFDVNFTDTHLDSMWYTIEGGYHIPLISGTGTVDETAWNDLDEGAVTIRFYANDTVGNESYKDIIVVKIKLPLWKQDWFWGMVGAALGVPSIIGGVITFVKKRKAKKTAEKGSEGGK